jgi:hypothetical protein
MNSFLQGKSLATAQSLCAPAAAAATPFAARSRAPVAAANVGAQVEVVKQGDKVVRLIITCACGERTEVDCIYPAGG